MTDPAITTFPTPVTDALHTPSHEKIAKIEIKMREILEILGLDLQNETLSKTPERVAKMFVEEIFSGLDPHNFPSIEFQEEAIDNQMVVIKNISFISFCEHHLVPIVGTAHVAYIPKKKLIGLSKINRIVRYFSKRPQIQERLGSQIADSLSLILETEEIAVSLIAEHYCVRARGIEDVGSLAETHILRGSFKNSPSQKEDYFSRIK